MVKTLYIIILLLVSIVGCSNQEGEQVNIEFENKLIVEKHTGTECQYVQIKEITERETVDIVYKIFKNARWEGASDKSTYPDFRINDNYAIWILLPDNRIKMRIESLDKNTFLFGGLNHLKSHSIFI
ncbi:hypothetical protein DFO70_1107 [Cytobacillus firmus]|uniref:Lipoprotein n=2 Tax=Cytobacillus TaxID=2675230 RepID=A0A366JR50_CYTFI|nr:MULTISPECIES: hypothetical protein [Cytobacillus]RBP89902.1 hypothetical protein DFO70_1107 [Cytobacillus firmus]TDX40350.1 hypothetical protein DFO72_10918 [Cytobacillus oceanisediminis]